MITTVRVDTRVKKKLEQLRTYPREPLNDVLDRLSEITTDKEPLSKQTRDEIKKALKELESGKFHTTDEVKTRLRL